MALPIKLNPIFQRFEALISGSRNPLRRMLSPQKPLYLEFFVYILFLHRRRVIEYKITLCLMGSGIQNKWRLLSRKAPQERHARYQRCEHSQVPRLCLRQRQLLDGGYLYHRQAGTMDRRRPNDEADERHHPHEPGLPAARVMSKHPPSRASNRIGPLPICTTRRPYRPNCANLISRTTRPPWKLTACPCTIPPRLPALPKR